MYNNAVPEQMIVDLVLKLKEGIRFVDYSDEALYQRAIDAAEALNLMILGLAMLDYIDPTSLDEEDNGFQIARAMSNPIFNHSWVKDIYGEG